MALHLHPAFSTDRVFDLVALRGQRLAGLPVGRCDCGGSAYLLDDATRAGRLLWITMTCRTCGVEAATTGRPPDAPTATQPTCSRRRGTPTPRPRVAAA